MVKYMVFQALRWCAWLWIMRTRINTEVTPKRKKQKKFFDKNTFVAEWSIALVSKTSKIISSRVRISPNVQIGPVAQWWAQIPHKDEVASSSLARTTNLVLWHFGKNSQYGTCWIYNENLRQNKKIKKDEIERWITKGWSKGRKQKI